jgi:hypothetical protein
VDGALFHALVPPVAYLLSTMTLPIAKKWWVSKLYKQTQETS